MGKNKEFEALKVEYLEGLMELGELTAYMIKVVEREEHSVTIRYQIRALLEEFLRRVPKLSSRIEKAEDLEDIREVDRVLRQQRHYLKNEVMNIYY